jgi:hypothetical protein
MFMKKPLVIIFCLFSFEVLQAQKLYDDSFYKNALGIKPNAVNAISYKHFFTEKKVLEGLFYLTDADIRLTGLYEKYHRLGLKGLKFYYGAGAHIGFWSEFWKAMYPNRPGGAAIGPDGIIGLDFKITGAPINISIDWQPSLNITGYKKFEVIRGGVGLRYTFDNFFAF